MRAAGAVARLALVVVPCFALGAALGLWIQNPGLLASYFLGQTETVALEQEVPALAPPERDGEPDVDLPAVAAAPEAPRPEPAPPAPAPSRAGPGGGFVVQVGAFGDQASAERLAGELRAKGYAVRVHAAASGSSWRVRVGPLASREDGERAAARLQRDEKLPTWILQEDG